ncbi:hypothetical protein J2X46_004365 [Nocardioides sp. BE266]|uniref:hypothetical protein n=1 Tax=Nocardioides sp. BE266 TaxID=2817725 RepID=UPI002864E956|nr:hypothetical protein [Nocardioides sp. BE266]MDR7255363.1 hypothetical protein [Nocardioides sp. BE266]
MSTGSEVALAGPRLRRTDGVVPVVALVVGLHVVFVVVRVLAVGGLDGFVTYDGRAYFRIASDPLTHRLTDLGITFTRPAYWQTRIGYPVTAWAASLGGRPALVPAALVLVNLVAIGVLALLGARVAARAGRSAWWGAVPATWAGFLVGLGQDLTEPLAGALLLGALVATRSRRYVLAAVLLTAAGLTRETPLLVPAAVLAVALVPRSRAGRRPPWWVGAVPLVVYAAWRAWVRSRWADVLPHPPSDDVLGLPGTSLLRYAGSVLVHPGTELANLALLVPALVVLVLLAAGVGRGRVPHERLALAGYLLLLLCLPVWDRGQAYLRWGCEPVLLGWLLLVGTPHLRRPVAVAVGVLWLLTATQSVAYPLADGPWGGWWTWS